MFKGARRGMESLRYPAQRRIDGSDVGTECSLSASLQRRRW
ncbi:hypothetical protein HMPREF9599_02459 [Cutibacterium acnes HL050PA2]|nr:hypothetical protein HMPREF9599_02459 [Cutibacterium acnes HL050PA2]